MGSVSVSSCRCCMFVSCGCGSSQCCVLHDLQFVNAAMHLSLWYVVLACHQYDVCENSVGSVYFSEYGGLNESGLCVFRQLCPVSFLVVCECPSFLF